MFLSSTFATLEPIPHHPISLSSQNLLPSPRTLRESFCCLSIFWIIHRSKFMPIVEEVREYFMDVKDVIDVIDGDFILFFWCRIQFYHHKITLVTL